MAQAKQQVQISVDEYLDFENKSDVKHEFDNGYIVAMVGASRPHNLITGGLFAAIKTKLKGSDCRVYMSDMKLHIQTPEYDRFYYPDIMVACDPNPVSEFYEDKPILVVEVLSPSTETRDKLEKLAAYGAIVPLKEYIIIAQDRVEVNRYSMENRKALLTQYGDGDTLEMESINMSIPVKDLYAEVAGRLFRE